MTNKSSVKAKTAARISEELPLPVKRHLIRCFGAKGGQLYVPKSLPEIDQPANAAFMRSLHEHGYSCTQIAEVSGVTVRTVRRLKATASSPESPFPPGVDGPKAAEHYFSMMRAWTEVVSFDALLRSRLGAELLAHPIDLLMDADLVRQRFQQTPPGQNS